MCRYSVEKFIGAVGDKTMTDYTLEDVERFKNQNLTFGFSPTSVNIAYRSMKAVFSLAMKLEVIIKSPFRYSTAIKLADRKPAFLSHENLKSLLAVTSNTTLKDMFFIAALSGMRLSEIVNLKWSQIDFARREIMIQNSDDFTTKTGKSRSIPMHSKVIEILQCRMAKNREYVFSKPTGYKFHESYVTHYFKKCCIKANLSEDVHFHTLRHSAASFLINAGVSIYEVQKILGHSSVVTTQIYSHLSPSTLNLSINKIQLLDVA
jgi:site-specific recombinase XerD